MNESGTKWIDDQKVKREETPFL